MRIKIRWVHSIIHTAIMGTSLYLLMCFAVTLHKACQQPHLVAENGNYYFLGFYMMAASYGAVCLILAIIGICMALRRKKCISV